jgi:flagellar hook-basal body complex protein FliE
VSVWGISALTAGQTAQPSGKIGTGAAQVGKQFGNFLDQAITRLNDQQAAVDQLNEQFVKGQLSDVHQLMIASAKASLGVAMTVQVRNKVVEAYQEIMRMQI